MKIISRQIKTETHRMEPNIGGWFFFIGIFFRFQKDVAKNLIPDILRVSWDYGERRKM